MNIKFIKIKKFKNLKNMVFSFDKKINIINAKNYVIDEIEEIINFTTKFNQDNIDCDLELITDKNYYKIKYDNINIFYFNEREVEREDYYKTIESETNQIFAYEKTDRVFNQQELINIKPFRLKNTNYVINCKDYLWSQDLFSAVNPDDESFNYIDQTSYKENEILTDSEKICRNFMLLDIYYNDFIVLKNIGRIEDKDLLTLNVFLQNRISNQLIILESDEKLRNSIYNQNTVNLFDISFEYMSNKRPCQKLNYPFNVLSDIFGYEDANSFLVLKDNKSFLNSFENMINSLSEEYQKFISLYYKQKLSYDDIAYEMNMCCSDYANLCLARILRIIRNPKQVLFYKKYIKNLFVD